MWNYGPDFIKSIAENNANNLATVVPQVCHFFLSEDILIIDICTVKRFNFILMSEKKLPLQ